MASRLLNWIESGESGYLLWGTSQEVTAMPDSPEWFSWLGGLSSFHFTGKHGHFTARQEQKARGKQGYWYAYRKANKRQYRQYLGTTDKLTAAHLETIATQIEEAVLSNPQLERGKRKPIQETKEGLRNQIREQEKIIKEKDQEIKKLNNQVEEQGIRLSRLTNQIHEKDKTLAKLQSKIEEQKQGMLRMQTRIQHLEAMLRPKR